MMMMVMMKTITVKIKIIGIIMMMMIKRRVGIIIMTKLIIMMMTMTIIVIKMVIMIILMNTTILTHENPPPTQPPGSFLEELMRHLGFVRLDGISEVDGTRWLLPECILLVFSPAVYVACLKLTAHASPDFHLPAHNAPSTQKNLGLRILNAVGKWGGGGRGSGRCFWEIRKRLFCE